jgi:TonB family protein
MTATATETNTAPPLRNSTVGAGAELSLTPVITLVLWLGCLLVGTLGFVLPYMRPHPTQPAPTLQVEILKVELTSSPAPAAANITPPQPDPTQPPPLFAPATPPQAPQLVAVAQPSPAVAFVLPVEAPARIVDIKQAAYSRPATKTAESPGTTSGPTLPVQTLTYGEGEGKQPAPGYPVQARRAGQEGTVVVRFSVGTDGRVLAAEPSSPSPWGTLNREALRVIREQWYFNPGPVRLYEVAIRFELRK